jgi:hypothetical protein
MARHATTPACYGRSALFSDHWAPIGAILFLVSMTGIGLAQTTIGPNTTAAEPAAKRDPPPGGCMPIGLTASGEMVFPLSCKTLIERYTADRRRPADAETTSPIPSDREEVPSTQSVSPADASRTGEAPPQQDSSTPSPDMPRPGPVETTLPSIGLPPSGVKPQQGRIGPFGCTRFRTYNPKTEDFRDFNGHRRPCRA